MPALINRPCVGSYLHPRTLSPLTRLNSAKLDVTRVSEAAGLGGDEEVERADGFANRFQRGTDIGVVQCGFEIEVCEHKEIEKRFEPRGVMRMGIHVLLYAGPKFSGDDHRNAGQLWVV